MTERAFRPLKYRRIISLLTTGSILLCVAGFGQTGGGSQVMSEAPARDIVGAWQGTFQAGVDLHTVVLISKSGDGAFKALFYGIDPSDQAVSANSITFLGDTVKWTITGEGSFEGELSADGKTIEGKWSDLGPSPLPLALTRVTGETAKKMIEALSRPAPPVANANFAYEVASVRPSRSDEGMSIEPTEDGISITHASLWQLIFDAFNVYGTSRITTDEQVSGLPGWARSDRFDIHAKIDDETLAALRKLPMKEQWRQRQFMLQGLLADRFKLKIRHETKDLPIYALVVAKKGFKLSESQSTKSGGWAGGGQINFTASRIDNFAFTLSGEVGRIVVDKTGLAGKYDIILKWTPEEQQGSPDAGPSILTALQEQLGLKLESTKGPVDTFVVDSVEKPSEN